MKTALRIAISSLETLMSDWNRYRLHEEDVNGREAVRRFLEKIVP